LKKCVSCGSISTDDKQVCGVCGTSLAGIPSIALEQAVRIPERPFHPKIRSRWTGTMVILGGGGLLVLSFFGFYLNSPLLGFMILPGLFILLIGLTQDSSVRGWRGRNAKTAPILPGSGRTEGETDREQPQ
jgi:hypothetical protein